MSYRRRRSSAEQEAFAASAATPKANLASEAAATLTDLEAAARPELFRAVSTASIGSNWSSKVPIDPATDFDAALSNASKRVAQMLQYPEDLEQVEQLKSRTLRKKNSIDTRLKASVQEQLSDVQHGMETLNRVLLTVDGLEGIFGECEELSKASQALQEHATKARHLSEIKNTKRQTLELIDQIYTVPETVQSLDEELADESANLLDVHKRISDLENCRDSMLSMAQDEKGRASTRGYFEGVHVLALKLRQRIFYELGDPIELVQINPSRLVTLIRIIEREERADAKACQAAAHGDLVARSTVLRGENVPETTPRATDRPRELKKSFFEKLSVGIESRFDSKLFLTSVDRFLGAFESFYIQDLTIAKDVLPSKFPPDYEIFSFYVTHYHNRLYSMLNSLVDVTALGAQSSIEPQEIMTLLAWVPKYEVKMKQKLGTDVAALGAQLLNLGQGGEQALRKQYLEMLSVKLSSWGENLMAAETRPWFDTTTNGTEEAYCPPTNRADLYYTDTPKTCFAMIDTQVEVCFLPGNSEAFLANLLELCMKTLTQFHEAYAAGVSQCNQYFDNKQELPDRLLEYMIACSNNCHQANAYRSEMFESLSERLDDFGVSEEVVESTNVASAGSEQGLIAVQRLANAILLRIIARDTAENFAKVGTTTWMRSRTPTKTIIATLQDYINTDIKAHMEEDCFEVFMQQLAADVFQQYAKQLCLIKPPCKSDADRAEFVGRLKEEKEDFVKFLIEYSPGVDAETHAEVLMCIANVIQSPKTFIHVEYKSFKGLFPDLSNAHFEAIASLRGDIPLKEVRKMLNDYVKKREEAGDEADPEIESERAVYFSLFPLTANKDVKASKKEPRKDDDK